jgi:predicted alpha/beta-fold hydrolase
MPVPRYPKPCRPPPWARGGHAQTLWGYVLPAPGTRLSRRPDAALREVALDDGDRLVVHAVSGTSGLRVHLFHGLASDADAATMRRTAHVLAARGHSVWAANHRGCGPGRGLARRPYHSGSSADLAAVLAASRAEAPGLAHLAVGFSLSGNALLLMAAEQRAPWLRGLIAVDPPVDLARASLDVHRGLCRLYELHFLRRLRRAVRERERDGLARRRYCIPISASLREFDDIYTAPEGGFASASDYYARCSAGPRLAEIATPGVILTAADDPFVDPAAYGSLALPSGLLLHVEPCGGHVGYLERHGAGARPWLDGALVHYVEALAG